MEASLRPPSLDDAVRRAAAALERHRVRAPDVLVLSGTGLAGLVEPLARGLEIPLAELDGVPAPWDARVLHVGVLGGGDSGGVSAWLLEDAAGEPLDEPPAAAWTAGFPLWLAAARGAVVCVHTSAGTALPDPDTGAPLVPPRGVALARDHVNASGRTPLVGLGASRLGPLFPDVSHLHHLGLRRAALAAAEGLGLPAAEAVVACTPGPSLETPAERRMLARLGAQVAVQALADPLLAAAHAGLAVLAIVAVADAGEETADVPRLLEAAAELQPALDALVLALPDDLAGAVRALREEGHG